MSLAYNQKCPFVYQPPGFVDKEDFQQGDGQAVFDSLLIGSEDVVGTMDTGHYQIRIGVHLQESIAQEPSMDLQDTKMSKQLQAMQKTSSGRSNNLLSTLKDSPPRPKRRTNAPVSDGKRAKATDRTASRKHGASTPPHLENAEPPKRSESLGKSTFEELELASLHKPSSSLAAATKDTPQGNSVSLDCTKLAELLVHCYAVQNGRANGLGNIFDQDLLAEGKIKRLNQSSHVSCECGSQHKSGAMVSSLSSFCGILTDQPSYTASRATFGSIRNATATTKPQPRL